MEDRTADWTFTVVLPVTEPDVAEIVTEPRASAVESPPPAIDATLTSDEDQVTESVMSCVLLSEYVPVAVNCWRVPRSKAALAGVIVIETRDRDGPLTPGPRLPAPQPLNKLRHSKTIGARCGFMGAVRLVAWAICRRRASSSDGLLMQMLLLQVG
jgi:hypothetical protein